MIIYNQKKEREDKKMMNREEMLDEMIRRRGFEDEYTVEFSKMAETVTDITMLRLAFATMMALPVMDEE